MTPAVNPAAPEHLPFFITAPGGTDVLLVLAALILLGAVLLVGVFFLHLHSLPERLAHRGQKLQFEIVAVLCLIALFTHNQVLWVIALLLAFIDIPDFLTPLNRMARASEHLAGLPPYERAPRPPHGGDTGTESGPQAQADASDEERGHA